MNINFFIEPVCIHKIVWSSRWTCKLIVFKVYSVYSIYSEISNQITLITCNYVTCYLIEGIPHPWTYFKKLSKVKQLYFHSIFVPISRTNIPIPFLCLNSRRRPSKMIYEKQKVLSLLLLAIDEKDSFLFSLGPLIRNVCCPSIFIILKILWLP